MAIVKYMGGEELTPEKLAKMDAIIIAAKQLPFVYDPDCPPLTEAQLAEFRPVNFATMEERARAMREAGIVDPDPVAGPQPAEVALSQ